MKSRLQKKRLPPPTQAHKVTAMNATPNQFSLNRAAARNFLTLIYRIIRCAGIGAVVLVWALGAAWAADNPAATSGPARSGDGGRGGSDAMIGKPAPDFELPLLKEETNARGEKLNRITDEKVKLSSLFGKQTIVLFMSSYT